MQTEPIVELKTLTKTFGDLAAVHDLSLKVVEGEILAVLGPSGCGKTTLLRLVAGFERPDSGQVFVAGKLVADAGTYIPPEQRRIGMVFQSHALFPHLTVADNIGFGLSQYSRQQRESRVQHLLNLIRLPQAHDRYPHELSGGQRQRVALARALAPEPFIVLMDEPFSNLDADQRGKLRDEVRFILKQTGTTVLFITHDQEEALFMGDSLAVMRAGELVQVGDPESVFKTPASTFVAEFLGSAEFLPATIEAGALETEIGSLPQLVEGHEGQQVQVGFRPDDVAFAPDGKGGGMVLARFFQGAQCLYRLRLPSGRIVHSLKPHHSEYGPGTPVRIWLEPNHALPTFIEGAAIPAQWHGASGAN
jgi:iron(III) transport system ATP-binding protein